MTQRWSCFKNFRNIKVKKTFQDHNVVKKPYQIKPYENICVLPFFVWTYCKDEKAASHLKAKHVRWNVCNHKEQYHYNKFPQTHKKEGVSFDKFTQMKPSVELAVKLKLWRPNVVCKTFIFFANFRIYDKVKNIKVRQNIDKV